MKGNKTVDKMRYDEHDSAAKSSTLECTKVSIVADRLSAQPFVIMQAARPSLKVCIHLWRLRLEREVDVTQNCDDVQ